MQKPPPVPKFIRNGIDIGDIEGAKPREKRELAMRDLYNVNDIDGAKPKGIFERKTKHD